jgi:hypothetical protein
MKKDRKQTTKCDKTVKQRGMTNGVEWKCGNVEKIKICVNAQTDGKWTGKKTTLSELDVLLSTNTTT